MSGAFPISNAKFRTLGIKSIQKTLISKSASGKRLARQIDGQKFAFTADIITAKRSDVYGELMAFIMKQRSSKESFIKSAGLHVIAAAPSSAFSCILTTLLAFFICLDTDVFIEAVISDIPNAMLLREAPKELTPDTTAVKPLEKSFFINPTSLAADNPVCFSSPPLTPL